PARGRARRCAARPATLHHLGAAMTLTLRITFVAAAAATALALTACGTDERIGTSACTPSSGDPGGAVTLPTWRLEDIQPGSPRFGQTYGLDTFSGKIVVVTLVQGY